MNKNPAKIFITVAVITITIVVFSCGQKKTESTSENNPQPKFTALKFTPKELVKRYNNCTPGETNCTYIRLSYIEATEGNIKDKVNKLINDNLLSAYEMPDKKPGNVNQMMETFINDFKSFGKDFPKATQVWTVDFTVDVYGETDRILCLMFNNSSYLGGAHPNNFTFFANINKESGDTLGLANIFGQGFEEKLNTLIDIKYREIKGLKPGDNLSEKGDLFENKISYTHNFAITSNKGIEFYYNAYDIAPYVAGPIMIKLSAKDIAGLLTGASPLK